MSVYDTGEEAGGAGAVAAGWGRYQGGQVAGFENLHFFPLSSLFGCELSDYP